MPRRNIYLTGLVDEHFKREPNKSALLTQLLAKHYGLAPYEIDDSQDSTNSTNRSLFLCKNGHLANESGQCLQKGCKYSSR